MTKGDDRELMKAFDKAWDALPPGQKNKWHQATEIFVKGTNPINTYRVVLKPTDNPDPGD